MEQDLLFAIFVALLVVLINIVLYRYLRSSKRNRILLLGINDSGKTSLFFKLTKGESVKCVSSLIENNDSILMKNKPLELIDIPGHEKIRNSIISKYKSNLKGLIFMIDSQTIGKNIRDVSEYLYEILSDEYYSNQKLPILIACNKQDLELSKSSNFIKSKLESEISIVKVTKAGALQSLDNNKSSLNKNLGDQNESFQFDVVRNRIEFVELTTKESVQCVESWLKSL